MIIIKVQVIAVVIIVCCVGLRSRTREYIFFSYIKNDLINNLRVVDCTGWFNDVPFYLTSIRKKNLGCLKQTRF